VAHLGPYDTQWLTRADFEPKAARRLRRLLPLALALAVGAAGGTFLARGGTAVAVAATRNAGLAAELERTRMELQMERATRDEMQRHADELSARVTDLAHQLEFINSRGAPPAKAVPDVIARE
jgi:hypothetical protein